MKKSILIGVSIATAAAMLLAAVALGSAVAAGCTSIYGGEKN